jgi:di/tricarboxylate transporter
LNTTQFIVFGTLALTLALFIWGKWRYDIVALIALLIVTVTGIVPGREAFAGFGHPAVITVAAVLILSRGLINSGVIDVITNSLFRIGRNTLFQITALTISVTVLSAFMNNVGALAIMLPVAIQIARKNGNSPSVLLMPLAFGSLLGGLTTVIGTPPNIIIALARSEHGGEPFRMFDYSPVGVAVALAGVVFISLIGWRLIPLRKGQASQEEIFHIKDYITEVRVTKNSAIAGSRIRALGKFEDIEIYIIGIVRGKRRILLPTSDEILQVGDVLVIEADSQDINAFVNQAKLELAGDKELEKDILGSKEMVLSEAIVMLDSSLVGRTAFGLNLRRRYGLNLLAVARKGARLKKRIASIRFKPGDVLLLNGPLVNVNEIIKEIGCVPLAHRNLRIGQPRKIIKSVFVFLSAVILAAMGWLPIQTALVLAAVVMVLMNLISIREVYEQVDWSIIVLLGAMMPLGHALETSGGAGRIAHYLFEVSGQTPPAVSLTIILVSTMLLSNIINNAAAAVLMAPIALRVAETMALSPDPFFMGVALGASCAFLTPIGHQSNTLVMGPGGYRFGDYWRMGLPLQIIVVIVGIPMICLVWPF